MPLVRPRAGLHVCHTCVWLLLSAVPLAVRSARPQNWEVPRAKLELDGLLGPLQTPLGGVPGAKLELDGLQADQHVQGSKPRLVDIDNISSDQQHLPGYRRALAPSSAQVGARISGCARGAGTITISSFDIPTPEEAAGRREQCLLHQDFSSSQTVKLLVPLRPGVQDTLTCEKKADFWECNNDCSFGIDVGRAKGKGCFADVANSGDNWWCYIASVKYRMKERCKQDQPDVLNTPGYQVVAAAVKTCESLGYLHQNLADGATIDCPKTGPKEKSLWLRSIGLMTDGMSWYMRQQGFAPIRPSWDETASLGQYCQGVADARKATLGAAFSANCLKNPPKGWYSQPSAQRGDFAACEDSDTLGTCFNKLGGQSLKAGNCGKFETLLDLLFSENTWFANLTANEELANSMQDPSGCAYKTKALWWAAFMGNWVRRTHGINRPKDSLRILPNFPRRYCGQDNAQEAGEACSGTDGEKCAAGAGLACKGGKCCKQQTGPAKTASHCCSELKFDNTEKWCYKEVEKMGKECSVNLECRHLSMICGKKGSGGLKCCGGNGASTSYCCDDFKANQRICVPK